MGCEMGRLLFSSPLVPVLFGGGVVNLTFDPVFAGAYLLVGVVCARWILRASWRLNGVWPLQLPWHVKLVFPFASFFREEYDDCTYGTVFWNRGEAGALVGVIRCVGSGRHRLPADPLRGVRASLFCDLQIKNGSGHRFHTFTTTVSSAVQRVEEKYESDIARPDPVTVCGTDVVGSQETQKEWWLTPFMTPFTSGRGAATVRHVDQSTGAKGSAGGYSVCH